MNTTLFNRWLVCLLMLCMAITAPAQSTGDKLYQEGLQLQKTMTVDSQNAAIKKFQAAKIVYTSAEQKQKCDKQIAVCNSNIKKIQEKKAASTSSQGKTAGGTPGSQEEPVGEGKFSYEVLGSAEVTMVVNPRILEFKKDPKGAQQVINVQCNHKWSITEKPDWVQIVSQTDTRIVITALPNTTKQKRSGYVTIRCSDKQARVEVRQKK